MILEIFLYTKPVLKTGTENRYRKPVPKTGTENRTCGNFLRKDVHVFSPKNKKK